MIDIMQKKIPIQMAYTHNLLKNDLDLAAHRCL